LLDKIKYEKIDLTELKEKLRVLDFNEENYKIVLQKITVLITTKQHKITELNELMASYTNPVCDKCGNLLKHDSIKMIENKIEMQKKNILDSNAMLDKLRRNEEIMNKKKIIHKQMSELISSSETRLSELKNRYQELNSNDNVDILKEDVKNCNIEFNKIIEEMSVLDTEIKNCEYIDKLLQPSSSFRTHLLEKYIVYLNSLLKSIIPTMLGNISAVLSIDSKGKGVDINITDEEDNSEYSGLSGGEKKRLDVCIILALQLFLLKSSGISINLLVFDEIFDSLDSKGVENVLNTINQIYDDKTCIYVISHRENIKSHFSSIHTVIREDGVARIE
jgi:DNA repair exonuclease SbcCD ATPase subunit